MAVEQITPKERILWSHQARDGELYVRSRITNISNDWWAREYKVRLLADGIRLADEEPDFGWEDISVGDTEEIDVSTAWDARFSAEDAENWVAELREEDEGLISRYRIPLIGGDGGFNNLPLNEDVPDNVADDNVEIQPLPEGERWNGSLLAGLSIGTIAVLGIILYLVMRKK